MTQWQHWGWERSAAAVCSPTAPREAALTAARLARHQTCTPSRKAGVALRPSGARDSLVASLPQPPARCAPSPYLELLPLETKHALVGVEGGQPRAVGVKSIVIMIHEGGRHAVEVAHGACDAERGGGRAAAAARASARLCDTTTHTE